MTNPIIVENQKLGTPKTVWDAPATNQIEGFASQFSVDNGSTVSFKINLNVVGGASAPYRIEIYRLGYYGGDGATLVTTIDGLSGGAQPEPITDLRGVVDAGNWTVSASWATPDDAVAGVYLAKLVRTDNGGTNQIPFVVRDDARDADIVLQTSDTTWQAYNGWAGPNGEVGGNLYGGFPQPDVVLADPPPECTGACLACVCGANRAFGVSYNRPFIVRDGGGEYAGAQDYLFGADYAAIHFLEKYGYDVSYISGVDTDRLGAAYLQKYKAFISVGHDEYWSGDQRANVEAARDAGVNLMFWSGNEVYWRTRWEQSIVDGVADRTLITYKETKNNFALNPDPQEYANLDPSNEWTGTWRDMRFVDAVGPDGVTRTAVGARPENSLTGQLFGPDGTGEFGGALDVPAGYAGLRVWRDTGIGPGGAQDLAAGLLGYEWNTSPEDEYRPPGLIKLSETTIPWGAILVDQGNRTEPGEATHNLTLYRAPSGALVFGAGTVFWSWGLSDHHDSSPYGANIENAALKQFTLNLLADMGIQPGVADAMLQANGLVRASASNDHLAATTTLNDLPDTVAGMSVVTISGSASDLDGVAANPDGRVAVVEVSTDGGETWRVAQGTANWTYSWVPTKAGVHQIKARAVDDSLNLPSAAGLATETVTVTAPDTYSLFGMAPAKAAQLYNDGAALELGMRFQSSAPASLLGLRYYRAPGDSADTDVRQGHLWTEAGGLLATVTFTSGPGQSGWQVATLSSPITLQAGATYVVSYQTADNYLATGNFFDSTVTAPFGVLSTPSGPNGVYAGGGQFPWQTYDAANYWVDVVVDPTDASNASPAFTSPSAFALAENTTAVGLVSATDPEGSALTYSIAGGADAARFAVNATTGALSFLAAPDFEAPADANGDNQYVLTVRVSDGASIPTLQAVTVSVTDAPDGPAPDTVSLFGAVAPTGGLFNDSAQLELGMRFQANTAGFVTQLRYYRAAADAGDTDVREGHLWSAGGGLLGTVTFTSGPGQSGWQVATLATPVELQAGGAYVVSYHTADNYTATPNYFGSAVSDATGALTAPASSPSAGNGVYAYGGVQMPTATYGAANYWVDLVFDPTQAGAPVFGPAAAFVAVENGILAGRVLAQDPEGAALTYAIAGGADAARFTIDPGSGVLSFVAAPNFEAPADANADNRYVVTVTATDPGGAAAEQALTVAVTDASEARAPASLAGQSVRAEYIFGSFPDTLFPSAGASQVATVNAASGAVEFANLPDPDPSAIGNGQYGLVSVDVTALGARIAYPLDPAVFTGTYVPFADAGYRPFNGVRLSDPDGQLPRIRGASIVSQQGFTDASGALAPLTAADISVTGEGVFLNVAGKGRLVDADPAAGVQPSAVVLALDFDEAPFADPEFVTTAAGVAIQLSAASLLAGDTDADGDPLAIVAVRNAVNGSVALDTGTGAVTFTPGAGFTGLAAFEYVLGDGTGLTAASTVTVDVTGPPATGLILTGGAAMETLSGGGANDILIGAGGADRLAGGAGADTFRFAALSDSDPAAPDLIVDFTGAGQAGGDLIDVTALAPGEFAFNGAGPFTGGGTASIRYVLADGMTVLEFDLGDGGAPEMTLRLNGATSFAAGDFLL